MIARRKPRRLLTPKADELSIVDRGANLIDWALLKGRDDVKTREEIEAARAAAEIEGEDTQVQVEAIELVKLLSDTQLNLEDVAKIFGERVSEYQEKRRALIAKGRRVDGEALPGFEKILISTEEHDAMGDMLESIEKVLGPIPFAFPFRKRPHVGQEAKPVVKAEEKPAVEKLVEKKTNLYPLPLKGMKQEEIDTLQKKAKADAEMLKSVAAIAGLTEEQKNSITAISSQFEELAAAKFEGEENLTVAKGNVTREEVTDMLEEFGTKLFAAIAKQ